MTFILPLRDIHSKAVREALYQNLHDDKSYVIVVFVINTARGKISGSRKRNVGRDVCYNTHYKTTLLQSENIQLQQHERHRY